MQNALTDTGVALDRYFMDTSVGRPAETTIALAGLMYSGVFDRFPGQATQDARR